MSKMEWEKSVEAMYPELAREWHPTKNGDLKPGTVSSGSGRKVWWAIDYYDDRTDKAFWLEWQAAVVHRVNGTGCPYLSGRKVLKGFNDLESRYPKLAREWHPTKNGDLKPSMVSSGSGRKVWWAIDYYDDRTDKIYRFEWKAAVDHRVNGTGCPYLSGKKVWKGFNDLESRYPKLAREWHPTRNGDLKPDMVIAESKRTVWWQCSFQNPVTGKTDKYEWEASVYSRVKGDGCLGSVLKKEINSLESQHPKLAGEWHPTKNGDLKPDRIAPGSKKKVWWQLDYHDEKTGKDYQFEWKAAVVNRVNGTGCPYLSGKKIRKGFNDLQSQYPEIAKEWHPTKNGNLKPDMVASGGMKKVWWKIDYLDPNTKKMFQFEWQATIDSRVRGHGCPYLSGKQIQKGFNDLESQYPEIAKEWHPQKNGSLQPDMVSIRSGRKVWWQMEYTDSKSGKRFQFEWQATVDSRVSGHGCPYLSGKKVWKGFNDLESQYPEIAKEWHPTKNGSLRPGKVMSGSSKKVWWAIEYFDTKTQKTHYFEWRDSILDRIQGAKCPFLTGKQVRKGFNDLESQYPELAKEWHPTKNRHIRPDQVSVTSNRDVWWKCLKCEHIWMSPISARVRVGYGCARCGFKPIQKK